MIKKNLVILVLCLAVLAGAVQAQSVKADAGKKNVYAGMLAALKGGDTNVDYKALRMAFAETENYSFHGTDKQEAAKMFKPLGEKNYKEALKLAEKMLEANYVEPNAHYVAYLANTELKDEKKAAFHKAVLLGLINSIKDGKDGKTAKTAFFPITIDEEYTLLRFLGYRVEAQSLQSNEGHQFDVMSVADSKTGEKAKFYFNLDVIWAAETKLFGK